MLRNWQKKLYIELPSNYGARWPHWKTPLSKKFEQKELCWLRCMILNYFAALGQNVAFLNWKSSVDFCVSLFESRIPIKSRGWSFSHLVQEKMMHPSIVVLSSVILNMSLWDWRLFLYLKDKDFSVFYRINLTPTVCKSWIKVYYKFLFLEYTQAINDISMSGSVILWQYTEYVNMLRTGFSNDH